MLYPPGQTVQIASDRIPTLKGQSVTVDQVVIGPFYSVRLADGTVYRWLSEDDLAAAGSSQGTALVPPPLANAPEADQVPVPVNMLPVNQVKSGKTLLWIVGIAALAGAGTAIGSYLVTRATKAKPRHDAGQAA